MVKSGTLSVMLLMKRAGGWVRGNRTGILDKVKDIKYERGGFTEI